MLGGAQLNDVVPLRVESIGHAARLLNSLEESVWPEALAQDNSAHPIGDDKQTVVELDLRRLADKHRRIQIPTRHAYPRKSPSEASVAACFQQVNNPSWLPADLRQGEAA